MRIIRDPKRLNPCVLVLGMFDGVHRGHQALLMRGDELAQEMVYPLAVCTFQPHPLHVLAPEKEPVMLTTLPEKAAVMQSFGVDGLCVTTFTRARANQSPEDFMAELVEVYAPVVIVCGFNFTFGAGGKGNGQMLKEYGKKHGFRTVIVPEVVIDGETVSSTRIRRLLAQGICTRSTTCSDAATALRGASKRASRSGAPSASRRRTSPSRRTRRCPRSACMPAIWKRAAAFSRRW